MSSAPSLTAGSVSRIECTASVRGKGTAKIALLRHLAPLTLNALTRALPIDGRVSLQPAMASIFTDLKVGVEKPRVKFSRGEIAFLPSAGLICFFLKEVKSERPLNPLGSVEDGISLFDELRPGDVVHLSMNVGPSEPQ